MEDFSEFNFGREEARSKGASGGWVFLVCNFLTDQVRFWAFLFLVCIFLADREHLGRGKCGGDGIPLRRRRGRGRGAQKAPGPRGAACLRYPWGGAAFKGLKGLGRGAARWAFP